VTDPGLVERLARARVLEGVPHGELEWLVSRGELRRYPEGSFVEGDGLPVEGLSVLLSGTLSIHVEQGSVVQRVMEWHPGDLVGLLPYSRMKAAPGRIWMDTAAELFFLPKEHFPVLPRDCPALTAVCVHTMLDRARVFKSADLHADRMIALGRLSRGLATELEGPTDRVGEIAEHLGPQMAQSEEAAWVLFGRPPLTVEQRAVLDAVSARAHAAPHVKADGRVAKWLAARGIDPKVLRSVPIALTLDDLEQVEAALPSGMLDDAVRWLVACRVVQAGAEEVKASTRRISDLVAAVKGFTYMGRETVLEPVNVARGLRDTVRILAGRASPRGITMTVDAAPDLPRALAVGSALNQIWVSLLENAIDAVDDGGTIGITATRSGDRIAVEFTDSGHGIPEDIRDRIFDPFFTTRTGRIGMGLETVRRVVAQHRGEVGVTSEPGRTTFRVTLPVAGKQGSA